MKKYVLNFFTYLLATSALYGQFIEEFRSEKMRRPPAGLIAQIDGYLPTRDINGNGSPDIIFNRNDSLTVMDGMTRQVILQWNFLNGWPVVMDEFYKRKPGTGFEEIKVTVIVSYSLDKSSPGIILQEIETHGATYSYPNYRFIGIADFDQGGKPEILAYDVPNQQTVILGYQNADLKKSSPENVPNVPTSASNYTLNLKYESKTKHSFLRRQTPQETQKMHDFNNDGHAELILLHEDGNGNTKGLTVRDAISHDILWRYEFDSLHLKDLQKGFRGFYDINGDNEIELIFGNHTVVTLDKTTHVIDSLFETIMILDIDNDGFADIIGRNHQDSTIQIWGKLLTTSTTDIEPLSLNIYPNPSNEYIVLRNEQLNSIDLDIKVFDVAGNLVVNFKNDAKFLDGSTILNISHLPNGQYMIQLRAGAETLIGQFIKQ